MKYILPFEYVITTKRLIDTLKKFNITIKPELETDTIELRIRVVKKELGKKKIRFKSTRPTQTKYLSFSFWKNAGEDGNKNHI